MGIYARSGARVVKFLIMLASGVRSLTQTAPRCLERSETATIQVVKEELLQRGDTCHSVCMADCAWRI